jgi:hypothetical protein
MVIFRITNTVVHSVGMGRGIAQEIDADEDNSEVKASVWVSIDMVVVWK